MKTQIRLLHENACELFTLDTVYTALMEQSDQGQHCGGSLIGV